MSLKYWLRRLSNTSEFVIVIVVALAWPIVSSTVHLLAPNTVVHFSDRSLCFTIAYELAILAFLGSILSIRGWKLSAFNLEFSVSSVLLGGALVLASYFCYVVAYVLIAILVPNIVAGHGVEMEVGHVSPVVVLILAIVNATFEEGIVIGYVFAALGNSKSTRFLIILSVLLRTSYHLYQGPAGIIAIATMGLLFAAYYARWKRLGPLIVAHSFMDVLGLLLNRL